MKINTKISHFMKKISIFLVLFTLSFNCYAPKVTFSFNPFDYKLKPKDIKTVSIAGTFNHWNPNMNFLTKKPDGTYIIELDLPDGLHYYKFVVNGKNWYEDVKADKKLRKDNGFGGFNSGIIVGESGLIYGTAKPNDIVTPAIKHDPTKIEYYNYFSEDMLEIKIRVLENDVEKIILNLDGREEELKDKISKLHFDYYTGIVEIPEGINRYYFTLIDGEQKLYFSPKGVSKKKPVDDFFKIRREIIFQVPDWAIDAVFYQIMIDRFYDGEPLNNPPNTLPWKFDFSKRAPHEKGHFYEFVWGRNFGGDIQGLVKKLPYLLDLGINAIYFNPVFEAGTYHKYDTVDYRHIDDNFGSKGDIDELKEDYEDPKTWKFTKTDRLFLDFLKLAHNNGIRIIIDGVFNHSGENFWAFKDLKDKKQRSKYKNWYIVTNWDIFNREAHLGKGYVGWFGFGGLPEYNEDENGLVSGIKEHIFEITKRWMDPNNDGDPSDGIDGWRLDVPDCVRMPFWREWCRLVRNIKPDAYIVGELWNEAPEWTNEKLFHAQMNYPLAKAIVEFFIDEKIKPSEFDKKLKNILNTFPAQVNFVQLNIIDSHDTDRLASMILNPKRPYDKRNRIDDLHKGPDYNPMYKTEKPTKKEYKIQKLIATFQFTYVGIPCIWYGTEIGMWGADDPWCRLPMVWRELLPYDNKEIEFNEDLYKHYRKLIAIRHTYPQFRRGKFQSILVDNKNSIYAFLRIKGKDKGIVVLNNSNKTTNITLKVGNETFYEILHSKKYKLIRDKDLKNKIQVSHPKTYKPKNEKITLTAPAKAGLILINNPI